ncbi:TIGR02594 family protein [Paracoccaceae bacterium GXU_MW_L88]
MNNTYFSQWFLTLRGYNPGPLDGDLGPKTRAALMAFQSENGLPVNGLITAAIVDIVRKQLRQDLWPSWVVNAMQYIGVEEVIGSANNPTIMKWAEDLNIRYDGDDVPWCGLFVAAMLRSESPDAPLPKLVLRARAYLDVNKVIDPSNAKIGDMVIFWRESMESGKGHVGFYMGKAKDQIFVLGGNQRDSVSIQLYSATRLLGVRRPKVKQPEAAYA